MENTTTDEFSKMINHSFFFFKKLSKSESIIQNRKDSAEFFLQMLTDFNLALPWSVSDHYSLLLNAETYVGWGCMDGWMDGWMDL